MKTLLPFTREEGGLYNNKRITINFNYLYGYIAVAKIRGFPAAGNTNKLVFSGGESRGNICNA